MTTLYCIAPAGGSAQVFRSWRKHIKQQIVLCPLELPGHGARMGEGLSDSIEALADDVFSQVRKGFDHNGGMYALFAHSMGCWISVELLRRVRAAAMPEPQHLFLSAMPAPHPAFPPGTFMQRIAARTIADQDFMDELIKADILPEMIADSTFLQTLYLPIFRSDFSALHRYHPEKADGYIRCPCSILYGRNDTVVPLDMLGGWQGWIEDEVSFYGFDGRHMFITSAVNDVTKLINEVLKDKHDGQKKKESEGKNG